MARVLVWLLGVVEQAARRMYGFPESHTSILRSARVAHTVNAIAEGLP
jgi:hypothetical protein